MHYSGLAEAAWEELIYNHEIVVPVLVVREKKEGEKKQHYKPGDRKVERNVEEIQKILFSMEGDEYYRACRHVD